MQDVSSLHVAILGMSFTGSTIVSYALGSLQGCGNVDESHWLVDNAGEYCAHCGPTCEVWTPERREALRSSRQFYSDLQETLRCSFLITADKDPKIYNRLEPGGARKYLMLYRDPRLQYVSARKAAEREGSSTDADLFLDYWVDKNIEILATASELGGSYLLNLADFQRDPETSIRKICMVFGMQYSDAWKTYWEVPGQHPIGGNFNPFTLIDEGEIDRVKIEPRLRETAVANSHRDSAALYAFLDGHRKNLWRL